VFWFLGAEKQRSRTATYYGHGGTRAFGLRTSDRWHLVNSLGVFDVSQGFSIDAEATKFLSEIGR
jgi:hypothetical protein